MFRASSRTLCRNYTAAEVQAKAVGGSWINPTYLGSIVVGSCAIIMAWENIGIWMLPMLAGCCPDGVGVPRRNPVNRPAGANLIAGNYTPLKAFDGK